MTTQQDIFDNYINIPADDWLLSELSKAIITQPEIKSNWVLPRLAPRPTTSSMTSVIPKIHQRDEKLIKRQRNTDAARKSRLKKSLKMQMLEERVNELKSENHNLSIRIAVLESQKSHLESKDHSLEERIRALENKLTEAHQALTRTAHN
ncbi:unnamed protein product [Rhizopus stolonifer]